MMGKMLNKKICLFLLSLSFIMASYISIGDFYKWLEILVFVFLPLQELSFMEFLKGIMFYIGIIFFLELVDITATSDKFLKKEKQNDYNE